jgi:anti-sigma28 factor (negative regulator of flagellin synthesis)
MQINGKGRIDPNVLGRIAPNAAERDAKAPRPTGVDAKRERPTHDSVSFSDEARALASDSTLQASSAERIADVKQRVLLGAYNTAEMAGEVARRILQRGDL